MRLASIILYWSLYIVGGSSSSSEESPQSTTSQYSPGPDHHPVDEEGQQEPVIPGIHLHPEELENLVLSR